MSDNVVLSTLLPYKHVKTICKECCAPREYMTKEPGAMRALGRHLTWSTFSPWCSLSVHMQLATGRTFVIPPSRLRS
ncbi:hypothetical protein PYCCODRAFT_1037038 [Trametes coccinea BRFM310]|uniref:Uncharacterized protein n=1 Tax=Trametes coccinea (strain BRFM310) TaxID=1353009 RepID=A0A1Y2IE13_TRAC3|nr:hypothetical protein PYCCODRAFT_1037038 [Trametes coccinea BRFM310]